MRHRDPSQETPDKFSPPPAEPDRLLERPELLRHLRARGAARKRFIIMEGQAGQGKTVFAAQLLNDLGASFSWHQIGPEDADPVFLAGELLSALRRDLPGFTSPLVEEMLEKGELGPTDPERIGQILSSDLRRFLRRHHYLVFDDLHLLDGPGRALLGVLIQKAPRWLRFLLLSRQPVASLLAPWASMAEGTITIDNHQLALSRDEVALLFDEVLGIPLPRRMVATVHSATEGWVMGALLVGRVLAHRSGEDLGIVVRELGIGGDGSEPAVHNYLCDEVLAGLPMTVQRTLLLLSLLDTIPTDLADEVIQGDGVTTLLKSVTRQNLFVRALGPDGQAYVFHHLFRTVLRGLAHERIPSEERAAFLQTAARWHAGRGEPEVAISYLSRAKAFDAVEELLRTRGLDLVLTNRIVTIHGLLSGLPEEEILSRGWLSYFAGVGWLNVAPPRAMTYLNTARTRFGEQGDSAGEFLALGLLMLIHALFSPNFKKLPPLLDRAEALLPAARHLNKAVLAPSLQALALSHLMARSDGRRAAEYAGELLGWATEEDREDLVAAARLLSTTIPIFRADPEASAQEVERAYPLLRSPRVSPLNKLGILTCQMNILFYEGDLANFAHHEARLAELPGQEVLWSTVMGALIHLWAAVHVARQGNPNRALALILDAVEAEPVRRDRHSRSMYLLEAALLHQELEQAEEAKAALHEALLDRKEVGGVFHAAVLHVAAGSVFARQSEHGLAIEHLDQACQLARQCGARGVEASARLLRAYVEVELGHEPEAAASFCEMLQVLRDTQHPFLYACTPHLVRPILERISKNLPEVQKRSAQALARHFGFGILRKGGVVPLLTVRALGRLHIECADATVLRTRDLSPAQRTLLAFLISAPGLESSQEAISEELWPESSAARSRANFDALLMRFRRLLHQVLHQALDGPDPQHYLPLERGVLSLENVRVDASDFQDVARRGLDLIARGKPWQGCNALRIAEKLWQGDFLSGNTLTGQAMAFRDSLRLLYLEVVHCMAGVSLQEGRVKDAAALAQKGLRLDPTNLGLARLAYDAGVQRSTGQARRVLCNLDAALLDAGYTIAEREKALQYFWGDSRDIPMAGDW